MEPLLFTNFTDEDFVGVWDKKEYKIKAGQAIYFEDHLVSHFAKHLSNREMRKTGRRIVDEPYKTEMVKKCNPALMWRQGKHQVTVDTKVLENITEEEDEETKGMDTKTKLINKRKKAPKKAKKAPKEKVSPDAMEVEAPEPEFADLD